MSAPVYTYMHTVTIVFHLTIVLMVVDMLLRDDQNTIIKQFTYPCFDVYPRSSSSVLGTNP